MLEGTKPGVESTVRGITYTTHENGVLITGTATDVSAIYLHNDMTHRLTRGIYYLTTKGLSPSVTLNFFFVGRFSSDVQNKEVTLTKNNEFTLTLQVLEGTTLNTTVQVALTRNKIATYSPYREQLLTLPTPNGLPGIPVTSGGNYTDQSGQQWVCDEVDLERGVKVQRIGKVTPLSATDILNKLANTEEVRIDNPFLRDSGRLPMLCNTFKLVSVTWNIDTPYIFSYAGTGNASIAFRLPIGVYSETYFKEHPTTVYGILATPIKTPLTPVEIAAYKALTAYAPDTVVQASDGAGIKLDYQRDVNLVVKNLEDAIASMTTT